MISVQDLPDPEPDRTMDRQSWNAATSSDTQEVRGGHVLQRVPCRVSLPRRGPTLRNSAIEVSPRQGGTLRRQVGWCSPERLSLCITSSPLIRRKAHKRSAEILTARALTIQSTRCLTPWWRGRQEKVYPIAGPRPIRTAAPIRHLANGQVQYDYAGTNSLAIIAYKGIPCNTWHHGPQDDLDLLSPCASAVA